ncbi:Succinate dehydrogenase cytochrome b560 subunit, mitochondrial [Halotydeus destructor]|nr:Succinate dehydrogenase cytochrome b560 subunit, mitochondrial [Halotydeus destructor]
MSALSMLRCSGLKAIPAYTLRPVSMSLMTKATPSSATTNAEDFYTKNERLHRPMSPWIIYKMQLTSVLSITHRGTGLGVGVLMYGWGISSIFTHDTNWAQTLAAINSTVPSSILLLGKVLAATAVGYHTVNGLRHLAWDIGYGFSLRELYTSGYAVIAITLIIALISIYKA